MHSVKYGGEYQRRMLVHTIFVPIMQSKMQTVGIMMVQNGLINFSF